MMKKSVVKQVLTENISYKLVSLVIALILWATILGRRDFALSKSIDIEIQAATGLVISEQSTESVKMRLVGPRAGLKKFMESNVSQIVLVDASDKKTGEYEQEISTSSIEIPFGVRVVSIKPRTIKFRVVNKDSKSAVNSNK